jgi:LysM repeat protein
LRKALLKTGKFVEYTDSSHLLSGKLSKVGGVYLSEGHHVVMVIENKIVQMPNTDKIYTVAKGDTLSAIAIRTGVTVANLVKWNGIKNPDEISIGQKLIIK